MTDLHEALFIINGENYTHAVPVKVRDLIHDLGITLDYTTAMVGSDEARPDMELNYSTTIYLRPKPNTFVAGAIETGLAGKPRQA